ncbi:AIM24 family protein [Lactobacillus sp. ESL0785]|uniref:AIM24 family protein n=1 Tax=Lactobacillus sp. ESL0785 TaxID=2983232 RepID=UPI0023F8BB75|nr:AIM24 family protein [Lactobacillus sp. ESL0785]WEV70969.1 AIM24 family protein [Lactobacillus sp. ESL0785]
MAGKTGGFLILHTKGTGKSLINGTGNIVKMKLTEDNNFQIDNVLAWEDLLDYQIESASGSFGFMSREGLVKKREVLLQICGTICRIKTEHLHLD